MESSLERLRTLLGDAKVSTNPTILEQHGRDENFPEVRPPLARACAAPRVRRREKPWKLSQENLRQS